MKIGFILPYKKLMGGGPRLALEAAQELKKLGHEISIYVMRFSEKDNYFPHLLENLKIVSLPKY